MTRQDQPRTAGVTPRGVREGDPDALAGLCARRGGAVLSYCERVVQPGLAVRAAADAFARFRLAVIAAEDPNALDPETTLLNAARHAAAALARRAPAGTSLRARLRGRAETCDLVPRLLAARADGTLGEADRNRLRRHLTRCAHCKTTETATRDAERLYRDPPSRPLPPAAAASIVAALAAAGPILAGTVSVPEAPRFEPEALAPEPEPPADGEREALGADAVDEPVAVIPGQLSLGDEPAHASAD